MTNAINTFATEKENRYNAIAADYLANTKVFTPCYEVEYISCIDDDDIERSLLKPITAEQRTEVEKIITECKKEEIPMWEYFEGAEIPEFLAGDDEYYACPNNVYFETPYIKIRIKLAVFHDSLDAAPKIADGYIYLTSEEYISLLSWQMVNRRANFGDLHHTEPELFSVINEKIRWFWHDNAGGICMDADSTPIYAIDLVEVKQDAMTLLGEPSVFANLYNNYTDVDTTFIDVRIHERKLHLHYGFSENGKALDAIYRDIEDVNAIAVQQALGVENYNGIIDHLKAEYGNADGIDGFRKFLDEHHIAYTLKENK